MKILNKMILGAAISAMTLPAMGASTLTIPNLTGNKGETLTLEIAMNNDEAIRAFQFDLDLPEGVTVAKKANGKYNASLTERADDHTLTFNFVNSGVYRAICFSMTNANYYGRSGAIVTMPIELNAEPGEYDITIKDIELTNEHGKAINPANYTARLTIKDDVVTPPIVLTGNELVAGDADGYKSAKSISVPVSLTNKDVIKAIQCDIYLPDGMKFAKSVNTMGEETYNVRFSSRTDLSRHSISSKLQADGALRIVVMSTSNKNFAGNNGVIFYFDVEPNGHAGDYEYSIRNIELSAEGDIVVHPESTTGVLHILDVVPGDVNGDGTISVTDATSVVSYILREPSGNFIKEAADVNGDGTISVTDATSIITKILNGASTPFRIAAATRANETDNYFAIENIECNADNSAVIPITLKNSDVIKAFQCDLTLPEGIKVAKIRDQYGDEVLDITFGSRTDASRHSISAREQEDGTVRMVVMSTSNKTFAGNDGVILNIGVEVGELADGNYPYTISNIELSAEGDIAINPADVTADFVVTPAIVLAESVTLSEESIEMTIGDVFTLEAIVLPEDTTDKTVVWTSSDEAVATVNNGVVMAIAFGEAEITATCGDVAATCSVTVNKKAQQIVWEQSFENVTEGDVIELTATATSGLEVVYSVSGPAKIDGNKLTVMAAGEITLTASQAGNYEYSAADDVVKSFNAQASIGSIMADGNGYYNVYTINGIMVMTTADINDLYTLSTGMYIINGRVVRVK